MTWETTFRCEIIKNRWTEVLKCKLCPHKSNDKDYAEAHFVLEHVADFALCMKHGRGKCAICNPDVYGNDLVCSLHNLRKCASCGAKEKKRSVKALRPEPLFMTCLDIINLQNRRYIQGF